MELFIGHFANPADIDVEELLLESGLIPDTSVHAFFCMPDYGPEFVVIMSTTDSVELARFAELGCSIPALSEIDIRSIFQPISSYFDVCGFVACKPDQIIRLMSHSLDNPDALTFAFDFDGRNHDCGLPLSCRSIVGQLMAAIGNFNQLDESWPAIIDLP